MTLHKLGTPVFGEFLPFFSADPLNLCQVGWGASLHSYFQVSPEMFDRVQVQALVGPLKDIHKFLNVHEWPSQSPDLNLIDYLWRDLKIAVQQRNMTELERICREWEKFPKYRCAKLVASSPRRLKVVIAAKGASTKY